MRICILTYDYSESGDPNAEGEVKVDPRPFVDAEWDEVELDKSTAALSIMQLVQRGYDLYFNLCDGAWDSDSPGVETVQTLERLDVPFTGADSGFFEPSREAMKRVCYAWGIDTPGYVIARDKLDLERAAETLRFPLIVKHPSSYSSIGLTRESRVTNARSLFKQARLMIQEYGGALIEEFIEGGECTVLVAENPDDVRHPVVYTPVEYRFPEGESFKHYDLKWVDYHDLIAGPVRDPVLDATVRDMSARMFVGLNGASFGRCDLRIDRDGRPYMLEINPNCGMYYPASDPGSADLCLLNDPAGHAGFTRQIVDAAFKRWRRRRVGFAVRCNRDGDYGLFATQEYDAGERIIPFEEEPHNLVTRSYVERAWADPNSSWFSRYAWPITDEIYVIWGRDPESWKPINHSCDPTAWLEGLDLVARVPLRPGDQITIDYATFCNEVMPSFACACGTSRCRGVINGDDYLQEFVERYGDHVSDYVRQKRSELMTAAARIMPRRAQ